MRSQAREAESTSKIAKLPSADREPKPRRRSGLPDDLLWRSDEEAARRLALKGLNAAVAAERRLDDHLDREALHDFRVAIRRLRSVLRAYRPQLEGAVGPKHRRNLRKIQRATGAGREAEVALAWLTKQQPTLRPEHLAGLNWLSAVLLERRRRCSDDLDAQIRASFRRTADKLQDRLAIMRSETNLLSEHPPASFMRCVANLTEAHATDLLVTLGQVASMCDTTRLHESRISAKRLRYLLEPLRPYVNEAQQVVKHSKQLQDLLGDLNDIHVLMREIENAFEVSMEQRGGRVQVSLRSGDIDRAKREASMSEWTGFIELHHRLDQKRQLLVAKIRDRWLSGELDALVARARNLAQQLRSTDQLG
ncbi:MAG: CHAD domain-containing protein [Myxococcales bacterium]|nr:CHAD domain-containing protein [Myxococcales bacterium]MDH3485882.1 CHAD domain-containing protein [Myxococcales bacterium]